ncbi:MAG: hypothetical protein ACLVJH_02420 [Faecalibacterium prausnitzii]
MLQQEALGLPVFALTYIIYIIGYTVTNMTAQTLPAIMTNDPRQRPTIGVWTTALNYAVPMGMSMLIYTVVLAQVRRHLQSGRFSQHGLHHRPDYCRHRHPDRLRRYSAYDKPESLRHQSIELPKIADVLEVLKHNALRAYRLQRFHKLAQQ